MTYDSRWGYTLEEHQAFSEDLRWESLETVNYVVGLLGEIGNIVLPVKTDDAFEFRLKEILNKHAGPLVFWLNEFMPTDPGKKLAAERPFTVSVLEKIGIMHTGPGSKALGIGLDKEATKDVFRRLGLPTPESYVVYPDNHSPIYQHGHWDGYVIIKPLLHGDSICIDEFSVVHADDFGLHIINEMIISAMHKGDKDSEKILGQHIILLVKCRQFGIDESIDEIIDEEDDYWVL